MCGIYRSSYFGDSAAPPERALQSGAEIVLIL